MITPNLALPCNHTELVTKKTATFLQLVSKARAAWHGDGTDAAAKERAGVRARRMPIHARSAAMSNLHTTGDIRSEGTRPRLRQSPRGHEHRGDRRDTRRAGCGDGVSRTRAAILLFPAACWARGGARAGTSPASSRRVRGSPPRGAMFLCARRPARASSRVQAGRSGEDSAGRRVLRRDAHRGAHRRFALQRPAVPFCTFDPTPARQIGSDSGGARRAPDRIVTECDGTRRVLLPWEERGESLSADNRVHLWQAVLRTRASTSGCLHLSRPKSRRARS